MDLFEAGWLIASHALAAMAALLVGGLQFALPKGTKAHRLTGYVWVVAMLWVALSSFGIHSIEWIGPFSPIHLLSVVTLVSLAYAVRVARTNINAHRKTLISLYLGGLVVAGGFTLLPGRLMHQVVFGSTM